MRPITELKNTCREDVYIVGSGASLDHIPSNFFDNKVVIGLNRVKVFMTYRFTHHHICMEFRKLWEFGVASKRDGCEPDGKETNFGDDVFVYEHERQRYEEIDMKRFDDEGYLVVGGTPLTAALHFAWYLGARNIILCGCDGASLDGRLNVKGYPPTQKNHTLRVQPQLKIMVAEIRRRGVGVMSINPFFNFFELYEHDIVCGD